MDRDALVTLGLALCCIGALGTAATTLESSVTTKPGDLIELDYESLPINVNDAEQIREQYEQGPDQTSSESSGSGGGGGGGGGGDSGETGYDWNFSLLDFLLWLLELLLALLMRLLPVLALIGAVVAAYRYRDRLLGRFRDEGDADADAGERERLVVETPTDEVIRTWYDMIRSLDLTERREKTPREFAAEAVDRGADPAGVTDVTEAFEEVRYGDEPTTQERANRARSGLERAVEALSIDDEAGRNEPGRERESARTRRSPPRADGGRNR